MDKPETALSLFQIAKDVDPKKSQYWLSLIECHIRLKRWDNAHELLKIAMGKGFKNKTALKELEDRINTRQGIDNVHIHPDLKTVLIMQEKGQFENAVDVLNQIVELAPSRADAWAMMALILPNLRKLDQAEKAAQKSLFIDPRQPMALRALAIVRLEQNKINDAFKLVKQAIAQVPNCPDTLVVLANINIRLGYLEEAESILSRAISITPLAEAHANFAFIELKRNNIKAAIHHAEISVKKKPFLVNIWQLLASLYQKTGQKQSCIVSLEQVIEYDKENAGAFSLLGALYRETNRLDDAISTLQNAVELASDNATAWTNLGTALQETENGNEAIKAYKKALAINPNIAQIYNNLGAIYLEQDKFDAAAASYKKAISIKPDFIQAYNNLGVALTKQGRWNEAVLYLKKATKIRSVNSDADQFLFNAMDKRIKEYIINTRDASKSLDTNQLITKKISGRHLRLNLIYCPYVDPINPPAGIASLKSYLEKHSKIKVQCMDLNLEWHTKILEKSNDYLRTIKEGAWFFKRGGDSFFNSDQYNRVARLFCVFLRQFHNESQFALCQDNSQNHHEVINHLKPFVLKDNPDIVGFSILFDSQILVSLLLAREVKKTNPDCIIVFGGAGISSSFEQVMLNPFVDFVISESGEAPFHELLNAIQTGNFNGNIPGVAFIKKGRVVKNDALPSRLDHNCYPDFSDYHLDRYFTKDVVIPILSSKGCFWRRCSFCVEGSINLYSEASLERVVDEIEYHYANGHCYFQFVDEMISAQRLKILSRAIIERGLKVFFYATLKPTAEFDEQTLQVMYEAGFRYVIWGVESCNRRVLKLIRKGTTVKSIQNTLKLSRKAGIRNHIFIIIGFPTEMPNELFETMQFLYDNREYIHNVHSTPFQLCEGSEIFLHPEKFDMKIEFTEIDNSDLKVKYKDGSTTEKAAQYLKYYRDTFFKKLSVISEFGVLRDHALLYYSKFPIDQFEKGRREIPKPTRIN
ncbi:MAG: tetratricopeptide repeat protein [Desulfobacteraceae bacterium]|nr:tetratricopeptide repeat protein [Desulfobacteraceae bacterium]